MQFSILYLLTATAFVAVMLWLIMAGEYGWSSLPLLAWIPFTQYAVAKRENLAFPLMLRFHILFFIVLLPLGLLAISFYDGFGFWVFPVNGFLTLFFLLVAVALQLIKWNTNPIENRVFRFAQLYIVWSLCCLNIATGFFGTYRGP